jgi:hypothetical protein
MVRQICIHYDDYSYGLRGHKTYLTILESADHALFKMVRYVLLRPLRLELDAKTKTCLAEGELSSRLDEQAIIVYYIHGETNLHPL